jgi:hypothetical protein
MKRARALHLHLEPLTLQQVVVAHAAGAPRCRHAGKDKRMSTWIDVARYP